MSDGAAQQVSRHRKVAAPALLVDDDEVERDPSGGDGERTDPESLPAAPHSSERGAIAGDVGEKRGDHEGDEGNDGGLLEEEQAAEIDQERGDGVALTTGANQQDGVGAHP